MNILARDGNPEVVQIEVRGTIDGQGKPSYDSPIDIYARVVIQSEVLRLASGSDMQVVATLWIDGQQDPLPKLDDRIATVQGLVGIVVERVDGRTIQTNELDHVRIKIREE